MELHVQSFDQYEVLISSLINLLENVFFALGTNLDGFLYVSV